MEIKEGTLVLYLMDADDFGEESFDIDAELPRVGLVQAQSSGGEGKPSFTVRVWSPGGGIERMRILEDNLMPLAQTDGSIENPREAVAANLLDVVISILRICSATFLAGERLEVIQELSKALGVEKETPSL